MKPKARSEPILTPSIFSGYESFIGHPARLNPLSRGRRIQKSKCPNPLGIGYHEKTPVHGCFYRTCKLLEDSRHGSAFSIGNTPLFKLERIGSDLPGIEIYVKAEFMNPGGSVKDRPALNMISGGGSGRAS